MVTEPQAALSNLPPELQQELDALMQRASRATSQTWKLMAQILGLWAVFVGGIVLLDTFTHAGRLSTFASFLVGALTGVAISLLVLLLHVSQLVMASLKEDSGAITTMATHKWE